MYVTSRFDLGLENMIRPVQTSVADFGKNWGAHSQGMSLFSVVRHVVLHQTFFSRCYLPGPIHERMIFAEKKSSLVGVQITPTDFTAALKRLNVFPIETRTASPGVFDSIGIARLCGPDQASVLVYGKIVSNGSAPLNLTIRTRDSGLSTSVLAALEAGLRQP